MTRIKHEDFVEPRTRRHRVLFAVIRIVEVSLAVLGFILLELPLSRPASPGSTLRYRALSRIRHGAARTAVLHS